VKKRPGALLEALAPGLAELGVMLPYSPLHALLLGDLGRPLVATSANISGEPVLTDERDVETRLAHLVEGCLHHDRPIVRPGGRSGLAHDRRPTASLAHRPGMRPGRTGARRPRSRARCSPSAPT
jgi:hypothetical protein